MRQVNGGCIARTLFWRIAITRENKQKRVAPQKSAHAPSICARTAESDYAVDQLVQQVNDVLDAAVLGPFGEPSARDMIGSIAFGVPPEIAAKMVGEQKGK